jgi:RNA polymerase sigma-70 factor (ECF subfamily)
MGSSATTMEPALQADPLLPLIEEIRRGAAVALGNLYDQTVDRVYAVAMRVLGNAHDAEEVVTDVYQQVWGRAGQFAPERGTVLRWLTVIAYSRALDSRRRLGDRQRLQPLHPDEGEPAYTNCEERPVEDLLDAYVSGSALHAALGKLSTQQRHLVAMAFLRGLSHQEIADETGMPLGTVKSHIRRGLMQLRLAMEELGIAP